MGDEGGGMAVLGGDVDLLVDHGVFLLVVRFRGFLLWQSIRLQGNRNMTRRCAASGVMPGLNCAARIAIVWKIKQRAADRRFCQMTQTSNRFFDEIGRLMNDAAGAAQGVKREVDAVVRNQAEKILRDLDIVKREEFEAVKDMARLAREENEALKARIAVIEAKLGVSPSSPDVGSLKTDG
jgi:hypothetical protein